MCVWWEVCASLYIWTSGLGRYVCMIVYVQGWTELKYTPCMHSISGREITKYTGMYGVFIYGSGQPGSRLCMVWHV